MDASLFLSVLQKRLRAADAAAAKAAKAKKKDRSAASAAASAAYEEVTAHILSLTPSALDLELRTLGGGGGAGEEEGGSEGDDLRAALDYFASQLLAGRAYELLQAALCVFLRLHQEDIVQAPRLAESLTRLQKAQEASWGQLKTALHSNLCLLSHLSRTQS